MHRFAFFAMLVLLITGILLIFASPSQAYQTLSGDTLSKWMTSGPPFDFLLVDVRETGEMTNIIATETCRPYHLAFSTHVFDTMIAKLPKNKAIILYCASGGRSGTAASALDAAGFTSVYSLSGGFSGWRGSTKAFSYVKPSSELPAASMSASAVLARPWRAVTPRTHITEENGFLLCEAVISAPHHLRLIDSRGRCVLQARSPFAAAMRYRLPDGIGRGAYLVSLETPSVPAALFRAVMAQRR
jgi:rhodanese-related sulfurtransferase